MSSSLFIHSLAPVRARRQRAPGFTMVEILTATGIMVVVISIVMTILAQVMNAWNQSTERLSLSSVARKALDIMAQDLQTAVFRRDGNQWLCLDPVDTGTSSPVRETKFSRLVFFTPTPLRQTRADGGPGSPGKPIFGDICAVEYRVYYADPFGLTSSTQKTFTLHRVVLDAGSTFYGINNNALIGLTSGNLSSYFDRFVDVEGDVFNNPPVGPNGTPLKVSIYGSRSPQSGLIDNVAQFTVVLSAYAYNSNSATKPPLQAYTQFELFNLEDTSTRPFYFGGVTSVAGAAPPSGSGGYYFDTLKGGAQTYTFYGMAYADITLTLLTDEGMQKFQSYGGRIPEGVTWSQFLAQYSETYTTRVPFVNQSL